jgi:hypothetical protein
VTEAEANTIIDMIASNWSMSMEGARPMWVSYLLNQDAEIATVAVTRLAKDMTRRPSLADLTDVVKMLTPQDAIGQGICPTCHDDRFVLVSLRAPVQTILMKEKELELPEDQGGIEEYAPCPDCNSMADTGFRRADGSRFVGPDPERVRALMRL